MAVDPLGNELDPTAVVVRDRNAGAPRGRLVDAVRLVVEQVLALVGFARARVGQRILPDPAPAVGGSGGAIPRGLVLRPALLGFAALVAIVVGDSLPSSPFKFEMPGAWFFGTPSSGGASGWGVYFVLVAVYGGLLLLMRVWWGMVRLYTRCPGASMRSMWWTFALWALPMLVVAPLFSRDVYSYAAQGEMVSRHLNPYLNGPFQLGNNSYTAPVDPLWGNAPAPYGPLFLQMAGFFAQVSFHHELVTVVLLRLSALAGVVLIAVCVPRLARHYKRDSAQLFTLMVLNPVVVLHLIGGAHNDALMLGLLVAGITFAKEKRPVVAVLLCTLATAIKAGLISESAQRRAVETMATLNRKAAEIMSGYPVNGCTDVTGFGLLGHVLEMAKASKVAITLFADDVPLLPEVLDSVRMGLVPAGSFSNRDFCTHQVIGPERIDPMLLDILSDAQTSGGLIISLPENRAASLLDELKAGGVADAAIVGRVAKADKGTVELR